MLEGRVHSDMRLMTVLSGGGVLVPEAGAQGKPGPMGKSVYDVFQAKHPTQRPLNPSAFLECE